MLLAGARRGGNLLERQSGFKLIDRILSQDEERIITIKNVSLNEPFFTGACEVEPEFPSAMLIEALLQTAETLLARQTPFSDRRACFSGIDSMSLLRPIYVGDQIRMEVEIAKKKDPHVTVSVKALVQGQLVCEGKFLFVLTLKPSKPQIHPMASVHPSASLGKDVVVGPYAIIGEEVIIGNGTVIEAHTMIERWTRIGENCHIFFGCVLGSQAQDLKYNGESSWVVLGDRNVVREYVTINRATGNQNVTKIGSDNLFLTSVHISHNCDIGNDVIITNLVHLGGHTVIEDRAVIGGMVGIHQFIRIGMGSMVGGYSRLSQDVPPFMLCEGNPAYIRGLNLVGLKRRGVSSDAISEIKQIYKTIYRSEMNTTQALREILQMPFTTPEGLYLLEFLKKESPRGLTKKAIETEQVVHVEW